MASYNHVVLMGNLTRDPELKYSDKGMAIAKVAMAINRKWTDEAQQVREEVTFVDVDSFGKMAENMARFLTKGSPVLVEGYLKQSRWENDKGEKLSKMRVNASGVKFLSRGPGSAGGPGSPGGGERIVAGAVATSRPGPLGRRPGRRAEADPFEDTLPDPDFSPLSSEDEEDITVEVN